VPLLNVAEEGYQVQKLLGILADVMSLHRLQFVRRLQKCSLLISKSMRLEASTFVYSCFSRQKLFSVAKVLRTHGTNGTNGLIQNILMQCCWETITLYLMRSVTGIYLHCSQKYHIFFFFFPQQQSCVSLYTHMHIGGAYSIFIL